MNEDKKQEIRDLIEQEQYELAKKQLQPLAIEDDEAMAMLERLNRIAPATSEGQYYQTEPDSKKTAAGIFAILLGGLGIHKFYLGETNMGILYLLFSWTLIPAILGIIDGINLLSMSDEDFAAKYGTPSQKKRVLTNRPVQPISQSSPISDVGPIEEKKRSGGCRRFGLILILGLFGFVILAVLLGQNPEQDTSDGDDGSESSVVDENDSEGDSSEVRAEFISTASDELEIPGTGYMDGRDPEADPPITLMSINIWNSSDRSKVVCELEHGTEVELMDAEYVESESRYYLKVKHESCEGWVSDPFVSAQKHPVVGDTLP